MEFKKLEIQQKGSWFKRTITSAHFKKTLIYSVLGAIIGYGLFYFGHGTESKVLWNDEAAMNIFMGLGFGVFLTNSPCARGRC